MQVPTAADVAVGAAARGISVDQMLRHAMRYLPQLHPDPACILVLISLPDSLPLISLIKSVAHARSRYDVDTVGGGARAHVRSQPAPAQSMRKQALGSPASQRREGHPTARQRHDAKLSKDDRKARRLAKRLCQAARNGNAAQMSALILDEGAPLDVPGFGGNTALMVAAWNDRADCVALLLERGAAVDLGEPDYGYTPLLLAAQYGALSAAQLLVMAEADLHCRLTGGPDEGLTARAVAHGGRARVYADPQPGRAVRASHSRDAQVGRGRIDSQHSAVAELLSNAERARVSARQRLAFASMYLEDKREHDSINAMPPSILVCPRGGLSRLLPRSADGGCDLVYSVSAETGSIVGCLDALTLSQHVVDAALSEPHRSIARS
jgi:hypothetical protein